MNRIARRRSALTSMHQIEITSFRREESRGKEVPRVEAAPQRSLRVLIVEDSAISRMVVGELLRQAGHRTWMADDGLQAVQAVGARTFDVVLMDLHMPEMDGWDTTRHIRASEAAWHRRALVIIGLTAARTTGYRASC